MLSCSRRTVLPAAAAVTSRTTSGRRFYGSEGTTPLRSLVLEDVHEKLGGKMVPFAGWNMPLQYNKRSVNELIDRDLAAGAVQSHIWTRTKASVFDVSHMCQLR